jgi:hypothetical protein
MQVDDNATPLISPIEVGNGGIIGIIFYSVRQIEVCTYCMYESPE